MNDINKPINDLINSLLVDQEKLLQQFEEKLKEPRITNDALNGLSFERIKKGFILIWFYYGAEQREYIPTNESLLNRIKEFMTAEDEGFEIKPVKIVKGDEF